MGCHQSNPVQKQRNSSFCKDPMLAYKRNIQKKNQNGCSCQYKNQCNCMQKCQMNKQNTGGIQINKKTNQKGRITFCQNTDYNNKEITTDKKNQKLQINKMKNHENQNIKNQLEIQKNDNNKNQPKQLTQNNKISEQKSSEDSKQNEKDQNKSDEFNKSHQSLSKSRMLAYQCNFQPIQNNAEEKPEKQIQNSQKQPQVNKQEQIVQKTEEKIEQVKSPSKSVKKKIKYPDPIKLQLKRVYDL